jgi:predicted transcriptional regulator
MSPRAAWRLESLGFTKVYDYVDGKADWFAAGLSREGAQEAHTRTGHLARRNVPTCRSAEHIGEVRERVRAAGWDRCIVVNDQRVVLGMLAGKELALDDDAVVEEVMQLGPSTFRPNVLCEEIVDYMRKRDMEHAVITTSNGRLVGLLHRSDAEGALEEQPP